jgi:predicted ATP-dependent endonuclease of OLD family
MGLISLKNHNFKPEIFFSSGNILVEGPGDESAFAAISDSLDNILQKLSIHIINLGGKDILESYVPILEAYSIPHMARVDYDYDIRSGL